jgi:cell division protein FtsL
MKIQFDSNMTLALKHTLFNRHAWTIFALAGLVFLSAIAVIYVKNWRRDLFIQVEQLQQQRDKMHTEWTQLLLEESTWAAQARIESMATAQLNMKIPAPTDMRILKVAAMPATTAGSSS